MSHQVKPFARRTTTFASLSCQILPKAILCVYGDAASKNRSLCGSLVVRRKPLRLEFHSEKTPPGDPLPSTPSRRNSCHHQEGQNTYFHDRIYVVHVVSKGKEVENWDKGTPVLGDVRTELAAYDHAIIELHARLPATPLAPPPNVPSATREMW